MSCRKHLNQLVKKCEGYTFDNSAKYGGTGWGMYVDYADIFTIFCNLYV